jgi:hypothetical protein
MNETIKLVIQDLHTLMGIELSENTDSPDYDQGVVDGIEKAIKVLNQYE